MLRISRVVAVLPVCVFAALTLACAGFGKNAAQEGGATGEADPLPRTAFTFPTGSLQQGQILNPRDEKNQLIFRNGSDCWVELPFKTPPTAVVPPPKKAVECPGPMMADAAWDDCAGGTVSVGKLGPPPSCECSELGDPPPPQRETLCPMASVPALETTRMGQAPTPQPVGDGR